MRKKQIAVRLDGGELTAIRKLPGPTDAERIRALIHLAGATDGLAAKIGAEVSKKLAVLLLVAVFVLIARVLGVTPDQLVRADREELSRAVRFFRFLFH